MTGFFFFILTLFISKITMLAKWLFLVIPNHTVVNIRSCVCFDFQWKDLRWICVKSNLFSKKGPVRLRISNRWEWSNVSNAKTGWDIITKFLQAPCNCLFFVLCKFQSNSLINSIFSWFKSIFIAFENKHPGGQVSKAVACKAWGHKFESRCKNFRFSPLPKKPDFANFPPSLTRQSKKFIK